MDKKIWHSRKTFCVAALFIASALAGQNLLGQQDSEIVRPIEVTAEMIEAVRKQAADMADLDAEIKQKIDASCKAALDGLKKLNEFPGKIQQYRQDVDNVAQRVADLRQQLSTLNQTEPASFGEMELAELETEVSKRETDLTKLKATLDKVEAEPGIRVSRRREIRNLLLTANQRESVIQKQLDTAPPANESPLQASARRYELLVGRELVKAELPVLQAELAKYDAEDATDFLRLKRDILAREISLAESELQSLQNTLNQQRAQDSKNKLKRAKDFAESTPPKVRPFADENVAFAEKALELSNPIEEAEQKLEKSQAKLEDLQKQFKLIEQRVKNIGLTGAIGALLRRKKTELPDIRTLKKNALDRKSLIEDIQYKSYEYDDLRSRSAEDELKRIYREVPASEQSPQFENMAQAIVQDRRDLLDDVIRLHKNYLDVLFAADATEQLLIRETAKFEVFIEERVLWIRSNKPLYQSLAIDSSDLLALNHDNWLLLLSRFNKDMQSMGILYTLCLAVFLALIWRKRRYRKELESLGETARRGSCREFLPTLRAGFITILLVIPWPLLFLFVAWRINGFANGSQFCRAFGYAMFSVAWTLLPLELVRRICRPRGLGDSHFYWTEPVVAMIRANLMWFLPIALMEAFATAFLYFSSNEHGADLIERSFFITGLAFLAVFLQRILHPVSGTFGRFRASGPDSWSSRLNMLWYWCGILIPLTLIGMTIAGFYYTANRMMSQLYSSAVFLVALQIGQAFLHRWLLVRRRAISIEQARERRQAEAAAQKSESEKAGTSVEQLVVTDDLQPDILVNTEQTQKLIRTGFVVTSIIGLWLIWVNVLPALKMLDRWPIWTTTVPVSQTEAAVISPTAPGMTPSTATPSSTNNNLVTEKVVAVTIADIALAFIIGFVTVVCARNIPGLMEISLLNKLPMDNSVRYAIATVTSYLIVLIGLIFAFNAISIGWSQVQWLATALTFGLAFGLQEIFANFVAGLILLFERPIRVGDIVTVDDVTGVVSRIRIRATTIMNWDRKEYVVPNKEFITGRMLNWTLSDKINRIVINIGVAYGSDVERAKRLLTKTCTNHPLILDEPKTMVTFEGFGDNTLNLVVRTYLPDLDSRLPVIDELHTAIDKAFRKAGIEIAFPQRDLHIRSVDRDVLEHLGIQNPPPDGNDQKTA